jgi:hypothetical protein
MSALISLLPKLAVFVLAVAIGASGAYIGAAVLTDRGPASAAGELPEFVLAGAETPGEDGPSLAAFDLVENGTGGTALEALPPADLALAAASLLDAEPLAPVSPAGFPRIQPQTQFDGGPFQNVNCTLAAGAMLARLGYGIVTTGSILRTLQDDQDGGTGLDDLAVALWRGYGVSFKSGMLRPAQLKSLLGAGYGAVIAGNYGRIPVALRLQKNFTNPHAIYVDGYYPGDAKRGIPEAYYVIDPIGRPSHGYRGDWWPASVVDDFGTALGGGSRILSTWGYPPGGIPPDVIDPDVLPIPPSGGGGSSPGATPGPGETPMIVDEPGDTPVEPVPAPPAIDGAATVDGLDVQPDLEFCLLEPKPALCPDGIEGIFELDPPPIFELPFGPTVKVVFVDSDRPNVALVGFTVDPPGPATVKFWEADGTPAEIRGPTAMSALNILGKTMLVARLDVLASTTYRFQAVAGNGLFTGQSSVGTFTTGGGVVAFDVALSAVASPVFSLGTGLSPYVRLAPDAYAQPLLQLGALGSTACLERADFGGTGYCLEPRSPVPSICTRAQVTYELAGVPADAVLVRAFPVESGVLPDGDPTLAGVLEAEGPAGSGAVSVGCLASGLAYHVVLDAVGDSGGVLAVRTVTVP